MGEEGAKFGFGRRNADGVEIRPSQERRVVDQRRGGDLLGGNRRGRPGRAGFHPRLQRRDLLLVQAFALRGHALIFIVRLDAGDQLARFDVARHHRRLLRLAGLERSLARVQPQAAFFLLPVAAEALLVQHRQDFGVELLRLGVDDR